MRCEDWPERLDTYIAQHNDRPYSYLEHNCCTFVAGAVEVLTNVAIMKQVQEQCSLLDEEKAYKTMLRYIVRVMKKHGFRRIPSLQAQRGDVVWFKNLGRNMLGLCIGNKIMVPGEKGLIIFNLSESLGAWRIE